MKPLGGREEEREEEGGEKRQEKRRAYLDFVLEQLGDVAQLLLDLHVVPHPVIARAYRTELVAVQQAEREPVDEDAFLRVCVCAARVAVVAVVGVGVGIGVYTGAGRADDGDGSGTVGHSVFFLAFWVS